MSIGFRNVSLAPLDNFTASAPSGAIIGIIGLEGSGVTQLLRAAAGTAQPTNGSIEAGPERRYLGPTDALNLAPAAVIALDQTLATQDALARTKTLIGLDRLRRAGSTILLASHDYTLLETLCDEVWWIEDGHLASKGDPKQTLTAYRRRAAEEIRSWGETVPARLTPSFRRGDGRAEILSIETTGEDMKPTILWKSGEMIHVRATVRYNEDAPDPVLGMMIRTQIGFEVYGTNTELEGVTLGPRKAGDTLTLDFSFLCDLCPHAYTITMASHDPDGTAHDWLDDAVAVTVADNRYTAGVANLRAKIKVEEAKATTL